MPDRLNLRYWICTRPGWNGPVVMWDEASAADYERLGWTVVEYGPVAVSPRGAVDALRALTDAVGNAAVVHLVANGPIRLVESEWREIEAKAMDARRVLGGQSETSPAPPRSGQ